MTDRAFKAGCGQDCPCQQVRALGGCWPVFSNGAVGVLAEFVPADVVLAHLHPARPMPQTNVRYFEWVYA